MFGSQTLTKNFQLSTAMNLSLNDKQIEESFPLKIDGGYIKLYECKVLVKFIDWLLFVCVCAEIVPKHN